MIASLSPLYERDFTQGLIAAIDETGLAESTFPAAFPWSFEQAVAADFWPE